MVSTILPAVHDDVPEIFRFLGVESIIRWEQYFIAPALITPDQARTIAERMHSNRDYSDRRMQRYLKDMDRGAWKALSSTIYFSGPNLVDGQTRIKALVRSGEAGMAGQAQSFLIVVRPEGDDGAYDMQHQRRVSDFLDMTVAENFEGMNKHQVAWTAEALAIYFLWARDSLKEYETRSRMQEVELLTEDTELTIFGVTCRQAWFRQHHNPLPMAALAALFACFHTDRAVAEQFALAVTTHENVLLESPADRVTKWINDHVLDARRGKSEPNSFQWWNCVVTGFEHFRTGRELASFRLPSDRFVMPKGND